MSPLPCLKTFNSFFISPIYKISSVHLYFESIMFFSSLVQFYTTYLDHCKICGRSDFSCPNPLSVDISYTEWVSAQSCLTLCDPMDCSPPGSSVQGDSPGKNTRVDCHFLLQGIFPTQGSNPCLLGLLHLVGRFFNTVPLGKFIILSEASQRKTNIICYRLYAESKKNNTNLFIKQVSVPWKKDFTQKSWVILKLLKIHLEFLHTKRG